MNDKVWWELSPRDPHVGNGDPYGSVRRLFDNGMSMQALHLLFPTGEANVENFVLFSTGGTHGTYDTIEDVEREIADKGFTFDGLTFVVIHPRLVAMRYGRAYPASPEDFAFLKKLRETSIQAVSGIGNK